MDTRMLPQEDDQDVEIELVEDEPLFLRGHVRVLGDLSPVRIVKNPDGSLAQAAIIQGALAKQRRENKMIQKKEEIDSKEVEIKSWNDPLPEGNEYFKAFMNHLCLIL